jgi:site-specific recombinase XerD
MDIHSSTSGSERKIIKQTPQYKKLDGGLKLTITIDKINKRIYIKHNPNKQIWQEFKAIPKSWWQKEKEQWILAGNNVIYLAIMHIANKYRCVVKQEFQKTKDEKESNPIVRKYIETMQMRKNSMNTIDAYLPHFKKFVEHYYNSDIEELTFLEIKQYIENELKYNVSEIYCRHLICAIKYYYENISGRDRMVFNLREIRNIERKNFVLPLEKLMKQLALVNDSFDKMMFFLKFGFDVKENALVDLKLSTLKQWLTTHIFIKHPDYKAQIVNMIREYYNIYRPVAYLFEKTPANRFSASEINEKLCVAINKHQFTEPYKIILRQLIVSAGLKPKTEKCYGNTLLLFLKAFNYKDFNDISNEEIRSFLHRLGRDGKISVSTINQYINALKFYYIDVLKRDLPFQYIYRPKAPKMLPKVISQEQIASILGEIVNIKHKCILAVEYSAGLRIGEVLDLKVENLDFEKGEIRIFAQKGQKERISLMAESLKIWLKEYLIIYKPKNFLFEGATGGRYSETSVNNILKAALKKAGIDTKVTNHWLRHSFATDLLEHGTDIRYIQDLLGHSNIKTTLRYTHVADIKRRSIQSPLDRINFKKPGE